MNNFEKFNGTEIAIIGMSGRFPGAKNIDQFWDNLRHGKESISDLSSQELELSGVDSELINHPNYIKSVPILDDIDLFDADFFSINPREAEIIDPQHRFFLECAWEALENAGYDSETYQGQTGVFAGTSISTYLFNLYSNPELIKMVGEVAIRYGVEKDFLTSRVSYKLNLKGPSIVVQTSCSTSLVAVHIACQSLLNHECDMALAGGVSISVPQKVGYLHKEGGILSPDGHCRAFDSKAQGTIFGSGLGIVVLKRLEEAIADRDYIYALIKGSAVNNDGSLKVGYTAPSVSGQAEVIAEAMAIAGVKPETISYVEAHGTATPLGDPIEIAALTQVFRASTQEKGLCAIGSVKTNVGHLNTAAGITGLIKTVLALQNKQLPPSINFEQPNPRINLENSPFYVNNRLKEWKENGNPRRAGVSSFGIGGTNAHVILEEAPRVQNFCNTRPWQLLLLSANTRSALESLTINLNKYLMGHPDVNFADLIYTYQVGRKPFRHRRMLVCQGLDDTIPCLESLDTKRVLTTSLKPQETSIVFMFPGQGSQYINMALELYQQELKFREQIDLCAEFLKSNLQVDLRHVLYPSEEKSEEAKQLLKQTYITQPAIFVIEYALAQLWISWGIRPKALIGHSIGEYVAACLSGVFSLEEALLLVATRGRLMQDLPGGAMLAVPLSEAEVTPLLTSNLSLAAINGSSLSVISGSLEAIEALQKQLSGRSLECHRLHTSHAFHSAMMTPILETFTKQVEKIALKPPQIPYISNLTGNWITESEATNPSYWSQHLRQTVRFANGLQKLLTESECLLLEVGPGRTLSTLARCNSAKKTGHIVLSSLRHPREQNSDMAFLLNTLGQLWLAGAKVDWSAFYTGEQRYRVPLPTYPFEHQRYWIESQIHMDRTRVSQQTKFKSPQNQKNREIEDISSFRPMPYLATDHGAITNEIEQTITDIWEKLLGIKNIGIQDNFFDLGGDSLLATQLIFQLRETFNVSLSLRNLLETPTIIDFANKIKAASRQEKSIDLQPNIDWITEATLDLTINPSGIKLGDYVDNPSNIFLTGSTGFLGAYLLQEILHQTSAKVHCLVRASNVEAARQRIQSNLELYDLWNQKISDRIIPVLGDLSQPYFNLSDEEYQHLCNQIDVIYHNGAIVNFVYPYHVMKATNVLGTQEILRLACQSKIKPLHYVSSIAVFDSDLYAEVEFLEEDNPLVHSGNYFTGYGQGKWVAEKLVKTAQSRGLPVNIYRPGNIAGDSKTGICHTSDMLFRMTKGCIQLGVAPDNNTLVDITPVNYVSQTLIYLSQQQESVGKVFNLVNPQPVNWRDIIIWINSYGYPLKSVTNDEWTTALVNEVKNSQDNALYPLMALFPEEASAPSRQRKYGCQNTLSSISDSSISCPLVDRHLLTTYFSYFVSSGFLYPPTNKSIPK